MYPTMFYDNFNPQLLNHTRLPQCSLALGMTEPNDERAAELETLAAIYGSSLVMTGDYSGCINISVAVQRPLQLLCKTEGDRDNEVSYLPPVQMCFKLPEQYPGEAAPIVELKTSWLETKIIQKLEAVATLLWEEYGRTEVMYAYISYLEEAAELAFEITHLDVGHDDLHLLLNHDRDTKRRTFEQGTYDCGVCLDPKKGSSCHQMEDCGHVFCVECLQGYYNNAILTGNINDVKCPSFDCGAKRGKRARLVTPRELLKVPIERPAVQRYVDLKRKKKLESDKATVWCPRRWCQSAATGNHYPRSNVPLEELGIVFEDDVELAHEDIADEGEEGDDAAKRSTLLSSRLQICEDCSYAFCRLCNNTWHGDFFDCRAKANVVPERTAAQIEEDASLDFIRQNTSKCPKCDIPVQKSEACNHMTCVQCHTHFCYLCSTFLHPMHPYGHFNSPGSYCYQRLWEGENGEGVEW
ncbi:RWD domain-containing protein [Boeremia exigua]|uniref:RWD domain-containing protein n=1 Tax=Boeremia exigua TaxID=749465 RepID=UPI001E8CC285|nr:RWD domain-containing protein [Boeremia exigua]KAH6639158.1 RWD domain-containing protein [Boeremia exigua]